MTRRKDFLFGVALFLIVISSVFSIWNSYEKTKLNQRYEVLIEQMEETAKTYQSDVKEFESFLNQTRNQIQDQLDQQERKGQ